MCFLRKYKKRKKSVKRGKNTNKEIEPYDKKSSENFPILFSSFKKEFIIVALVYKNRLVKLLAYCKESKAGSIFESGYLIVYKLL